jgi:hypothetical protein
VIVPDLPTRTEGECKTHDMQEGLGWFSQGQVLGERYEILELLRQVVRAASPWVRASEVLQIRFDEHGEGLEVAEPFVQKGAQ